MRDILLREPPLIDDFFEHMNQVVELSVDVSNYDHRLTEFCNIWLLFYLKDLKRDTLPITLVTSIISFISSARPIVP